MNIGKKIILLAFLLVCTLASHDGLRADKYTSGDAEQNKICLTMIVKNEGKIIERCLDSVKDIVDYISICDTGSTDDTVSIIEEYMQSAGIPGIVHRQEWKNFGHNRTFSVEAAQQWLAQEGVFLDDTYLLLLDADMMLEVRSDFKKDSLLFDSYLITQRNYSYIYYNTRLIRASLPWECVGVTHEYWACKTPCRESRLETLSIDDRDDGGSKADKFERDVRLLTKGLEEEPDNSRYMFYLATSYHCLKDFDEAIKWYGARIAMGGWYEEVWYSKYMMGTCYQEMGQWDQALSCYLSAYQYNPGRAEPLQLISKYYRENGFHDLAYVFAKQGSAIPFPYHQSLFISYPVYDYLFDEDISISAYYTPYKEEGFAAVNRLLLNKNIPYYTKEQAYSNSLFYVEPLQDAWYQTIKIDPPFIREELGIRYQPMNPTIIKTAEGYDLICRTVNYIQIGAKYYQSLDLLDPSNTIKTKNIFAQYDRNLNLLSQQEIIEDLPRDRKMTRNIEGLEDCRMFEFDGSNWFTCTTLDTNPTGQPQISLCKLSDDRSDQTIQVEKLIPLVGPDLFRCEKNWLPFVKDDEFHVIYSYDPFIVYKPQIDNKFAAINNSAMAIYKPQESDLSRFSGSAPPIPFDDGYLMLVHEAFYTDQRIYLHRYVYLDQDLNMTKVSKPFIFLHKGIEYCCGMAIDHSETNLIMSIGLEDREAYLCIVDLDRVRSMLEPL